MKNVRIYLLTTIAFLLCGLIAAQTNGNTKQLPSAPPATVAPSQPQAPEPQQPPQDLSPKADEPIFKSLEPKKPTPAPVKAKTSEPSQQEKTDPPGKSDPDSASASATAALPEGENLFKVTSNEVSVVFTATDKRGHFIKDLKKEDITVLDDKKPIEQLRSFNAETNLPLRVGLLIDASNSIRDRFKFEQEAAIEFLNQIVRRQDLAFVVGFDVTPELEADYTNNLEKLSNGVRIIRPGGGTALFDAVYKTAKEKMLEHKDKQTVRRAIILLSDGDDNQSRVTREEAIEMAQRAEIVVYCISTDTSNMVGKGDKVLERISEATGGRTFHPFQIQDVANAFTEIQAELRSQYAISYKPAQLVADGSFRSIDIQTPNKKYRIRARKGYFAPKH